MAKRRKRNKKQNRRQTNCTFVIGIVVVGLVVLGGFMALALQEPETAETLTLATYCQDTPENCITSGNPDAAVTIVEVSDFGCPHCRDFHKETLPALTEQYIDTGQVHWVTLPFALSSTRLPVTNAALCANEQEAYFAMSELLFDQQDSPLAFTRDGYMLAADALGLDMEAFAACVDDGRYEDTIISNMRTANGLGINSTPTFFINGRKITGAQPLAVFQQQIEAAVNTN
jgi:protein-disulfide isomerase